MQDILHSVVKGTCSILCLQNEQLKSINNVFFTNNDTNRLELQQRSNYCSELVALVCHIQEQGTKFMPAPW